MAIPLRSPEELDALAHAGSACSAVLDTLARACAPGVTTLELDALAREAIAAHGAEPLVLGYTGPARSGRPARSPFPGVMCVSINEELVHGPPGHRLVRPGDVVSIDLGLKLRAWCADAARTL